MSDGQKVVSLVERTGAPSLADIVGQLRNLANLIEAGQYGAEACMVVLVEAPATPPAVFGYGMVGDNFRAAGVLTAGLNVVLQMGPRT